MEISPEVMWLYDSLPVGIAILDRQRVYRYANPGFASTQGLYAPSMRGRPFDQSPPHWIDLLAPLITRAEEERKPTDAYDVKLVYPGVPRLSRRWDVTVLPWITDGDVQGFYVYLTDVTCRREMEEARAIETRLRGVLEAALDAILVIDDHGTILEANPAASRLFDYPLDALTGMSLPQLMPPDSRDQHKRGMQRYLHTGVPHLIGTVYDVEALRRDGTLVPCELSVAESIEHGGRRNFVGIMRDVSERRRAEAERERLLAELDSTLESIADGLILFGPDGYIFRMNQAALEITNLPPDLRGSHMSILLEQLQMTTADGKPLPLEQLPVYRALQGETIHGMVLTIRPPGREVVWVVSSAAAIRSFEGELLGAVTTFTDITAQRELELEREVYIHTISHDLRVPLTVIQGHVQLLEETLPAQPVDEDARHSVEAIDSAARRMNVMIRDLVDSARLESGQINIAPRPIALEPFLRALLDRVKASIAVERLRLDIPPDLPQLLVDPNHLERILLNLITNALKYSPADQPVDLRAAAQDGQVGITVTDRGPGIAPEDLPHMFERFFRARATRAVEGIGLGLYITRRLAEVNGGRVWVQSELGQGSIFGVSLPMAAGG
jgi:PAS domain S-box-containing protein